MRLRHLLELKIKHPERDFQERIKKGESDDQIESNRHEIKI